MALLPAAAGWHKSADLCPFWDQGEGAVAMRGLLFSRWSTGAQVPCQIIEAYLKACPFYVMYITFLLSNQVTWPSTQLIGQGNSS